MISTNRSSVLQRTWDKYRATRKYRTLNETSNISSYRNNTSPRCEICANYTFTKAPVHKITTLMKINWQILQSNGKSSNSTKSIQIVRHQKKESFQSIGNCGLIILNNRRTTKVKSKTQNKRRRKQKIKNRLWKVISKSIRNQKEAVRSRPLNHSRMMKCLIGWRLMLKKITRTVTLLWRPRGLWNKMKKCTTFMAGGLIDFCFSHTILLCQTISTTLLHSDYMLTQLLTSNLQQSKNWYIWARRNNLHRSSWKLL